VVSAKSRIRWPYARFDLIFTSFGDNCKPMTKSSTTEVQRNNAERQLFGARRALAHLVEMYDKGQWRLFYKKERGICRCGPRRPTGRRALDQYHRQVRQRIDSGPLKPP